MPKVSETEGNPSGPSEPKRKSCAGCRNRFNDLNKKHYFCDHWKVGLKMLGAGIPNWCPKKK